jgi:transposase-like protein
LEYTNLTHGYIINDEIRPLCTDCNQNITVEHILWHCPNYNIQRSRSNISREALEYNKEEAKRVIKYLKKIGLFHYM